MSPDCVLHVQYFVKYAVCILRNLAMTANKKLPKFFLLYAKCYREGQITGPAHMSIIFDRQGVTPLIRRILRQWAETSFSGGGASASASGQAPPPLTNRVTGGGDRGVLSGAYFCIKGQSDYFIWTRRYSKCS